MKKPLIQTENCRLMVGNRDMLFSSKDTGLVYPVIFVPKAQSYFKIITLSKGLTSEKVRMEYVSLYLQVFERKFENSPQRQPVSGRAYERQVRSILW